MLDSAHAEVMNGTIVLSGGAPQGNSGPHQARSRVKEPVPHRTASSLVHSSPPDTLRQPTLGEDYQVLDNFHYPSCVEPITNFFNT